MLGSGAMTNSIEEVVDNDTIFVIGSNTTEAHPVIGASIKQAVKKGAGLPMFTTVNHFLRIPVLLNRLR